MDTRQKVRVRNLRGICGGCARSIPRRQGFLSFCSDRCRKRSGL